MAGDSYTMQRVLKHKQLEQRLCIFLFTFLLMQDHMQREE